MTLAEMRMLQPGDRVEIIASWDQQERRRENTEGEMDPWLGTVATVTELGRERVKIEEDGGKWNWFYDMLVRNVDDALDDIELQPLSELLPTGFF